MPWLQVSFDITEQDVESLETKLEELGALSVTLRDAEDQPLFEPPPGELPLWSHIKVSALFDAEQDTDALAASLQHIYPDSLSRWQVETLADQDWERAWMEDFEPMRFGKRLWIVPSHLTPPDSDAVNLVLDPGLAFGTGTHPTTALCLEWLDQHPPAGQQVLDFGCGSGVLALAALKLGAQAVTGVDIDEQALLASRDNLQRNALNGDFLTLCYPNELSDSDRFELVIANILAGPLVQLAEELTSRLLPAGKIVLSGILDERVEDVVAAYSPLVEILDVTVQEGWARVWGQSVSN